ncbi:MAG: type II CRISPR RNA-guided endonuclease Cas9 [Moheibacter sp.]
MAKIIGIDAGSNSLGWAIRNTDLESDQIIDYGVLTFDKGVASEKGNEFPKVQKRTESRGKRRNYQAEKYRKWELLEFLIKKGMCPLSLEELKKWKNYTKGQKREYPQSENFINWLRFDFNNDGKPDFHLFEKDKNESYYVFRALVIDEKFKNVYQDNPNILGRVFYQLVQRRGFRGRDEEEAKTMLQGSEKTGTKGRNDIAKYIEKHKTLGAALYYYQKENGGRIRQRYNLRKDYENELKEICKVHRISDEDYKKLAKAIIWQRPLRTQKGLVGMCIYERNKKRVQVSHPLYEEYRTWNFINNLNIIPPFQEDLEAYLLNNIYPLFYRASNDFELSVIDKQLLKDGAKRGSKHSPKTKMISAKLLKSFQDLLGENWKEEYGWNLTDNRESQPKKKIGNGYTFEDIWHVLNTFDGQENLKSFALNKLNLDEEKAEKFSKIKLNKGYATLSLSAIKKMLPFMQKGFLYSQSVYLANLYKVLGSDKITDGLIEYFAEEIKAIIDKNKEEKTLNNIVNSLVQDELNSEHRYAIEFDRELDDAELRQIKAKIIEVFGEKTWEGFEEEKKQEYFNYVSAKFKEFLKKSVLSKHNVFVEQPRLHDQIFALIEEKYQISEERKKYLWHPSEQETYVAAFEYYHFKHNGKDVYIKEDDKNTFVKKYPEADFEGRSLKLLGSPEPISKGFKNPMALKSLYKLKHLLNYLLQNGKIDEDTRVVVEIARELNDANKRKAIERWNNEREKENEIFRKKIIEINKECGTNFDENDKTLIRKIRLWEEQGKQCLYTGKMIPARDVFNGSKYDIEHTIPASMSFDSELKNLTLADMDYNRNTKKKLFPTQLPNYDKEMVVNGVVCQPIINTMERIFGKRSVKVEVDKKGNEKRIVVWKKIDDLENQYKEWKNKSVFAPTKGYKDYCIQQYHYVKMNLDYLKAKLHTFTLEEYKAGWKNSQLRDTQIVTKYALPYLKTVFKKVSVEKGSVVNAFKEIYEVKVKDEKKDRSVHSHHAIDAAILTLIPPHYDRDKILLKYNEEKDKKTGKTYHEKPKDWKDFSASKILKIENEIFINNLLENKTTIPTFKAVRKKRKVVWIDKSKNIKKIAQGDTIRGQLHGESLYGAIKLPKRNEENQILFDENKKMILEETPILVIRKDLVYKKDANSPGFKALDEIEKVIVDKDLFQMIKKQVEEAPDFKTALINGIYMIDKKGNRVNKIRRIRCKESMKYETAIKVHTHSFKSDKEYKRFTLAKNGENALCLFYKNEKAKAINILSISQVAELKFRKDQQYFDEPYYNQMEVGKGKNKSLVPLYAVLRTGQKVLFYKESRDELKDISKEDLSKRLFKIYQFESDGRIKFRHHLAAGIDTELKKDNQEYSYFSAEEKQVFLRLRQANWNFAIDGVDFDMNLDGTIKFNF